MSLLRHGPALLRRLARPAGWRLLRYLKDCDFNGVVARHLLRTDDFVFVSIGANDGRRSDPAYPFVRDFGWRGVAVEPQPALFARLQATFADCPRVRCVRAAIADAPGTRTLYRLPDDDPALPEFATGLASFYREVVLRHAGAIPGLAEKIIAEAVPCLTFAQLLAEAGLAQVDYVQVDTEGYDYEILKAMELARWRPRLVRYEHKHLSAADRAAAQDLLASLGYLLLVESYDTTAYQR